MVSSQLASEPVSVKGKGETAVRVWKGGLEELGGEEGGCMYLSTCSSVS